MPHTLVEYGVQQETDGELESGQDLWGSPESKGLEAVCKQCSETMLNKVL